MCRNAAEDKGYSGGAWFWLGFIFGVPALLVICVKKNRDFSYYRTKTVNTLRKYKRMLDSGAITPEEFERKRAELLDL